MHISVLHMICHNLFDVAIFVTPISVPVLENGKNNYHEILRVRSAFFIL